MNRLTIVACIALGLIGPFCVIDSTAETISGELIVTGNTALQGSLSVTGRTVNRQTVFLGGDPDTYYPVLFRDVGWAFGAFELQLYRSSVHTDSEWKGSVMAKFTSHSSAWGNGSEYLTASIREYSGSHIADYKLPFRTSGIVIWLKGQTTYYYHSPGGVPNIVYNDSGDGYIIIKENAGQVVESEVARTTVDTEKLMNGDSFYDEVTIGKSLGIGVANADATLHVRHSDSGYEPDGTASVFLESNGTSNSHHIFQTATTGGGRSFSITNAGNVGIGTSFPDNKLEVNGTIRAKEVIVESANWPDYVFADGYKLMPLVELESYIESNRRLPHAPSAEEVVAKGLSLSDSQTLQMQKIEELTLYVIQLKNENSKLVLENDLLFSRLSQVESTIDSILKTIGNCVK